MGTTLRLFRFTQTEFAWRKAKLRNESATEPAVQETEQRLMEAYAAVLRKLGAERTRDGWRLS